MDYTKLPRHLIYKDRKDIDDFPVNSKFDYQFMEEAFLKLLESRPFIKELYEASEMILNIFNNARYITTLICLENHPNHYFRKYLRIAGSDDRSITIANHAMPATMALVKNYLCHYMPNLYNGSKIVEDITNNFNTVAWKEDTHGGFDDFNKLVISNEVIPAGRLSDPNFEPRDIREIVNDPFVTERDISENIDFIMDSLEKSVAIFDEEIAPLNAMYKKVESWFPSDLDDNLHKELALGKIEKRLKKLDPNNAFEFFNLMNDMEKSLYSGTPVSPKTKEDINNYTKKILGVSMDEIEAASQSEQSENENNNDTQLADLKAENIYLRNEIEKLKREIKDVDDRHSITQEQFDSIFYPNGRDTDNNNAPININENQSADENLRQQLADAQKTIEEQAQTINEQQAELERLTTMNEVLTKQNTRFDEENPEMNIDEKTALSIKESIIFFSSIMDCNLNKEDISQMNLARFISKFTQWSRESIRSKIVDINTERENNAKDHTAFSDGVHQAAVNVCALIENAMEGLNKNPLPYSCKQAVENIRNIYKSPGQKIELHEIAEAKKNLKKI